MNMRVAILLHSTSGSGPNVTTKSGVSAMSVPAIGEPTRMAAPWEETEQPERVCQPLQPDQFDDDDRTQCDERRYSRNIAHRQTADSERHDNTYSYDAVYKESKSHFETHSCMWQQYVPFHAI